MVEEAYIVSWTVKKNCLKKEQKEILLRREKKKAHTCSLAYFHWTKMSGREKLSKMGHLETRSVRSK